MADSYSQIHLQFVFAVKYRKALIDKEWKERLHEYITGIVQNNRHKMLQINSMPDHIHMFLGFRPYQAISALIQNIKTESSKWIKNNFSIEFSWQDGFGAFSYSKRDVNKVITYIKNQELHHQNESFIDEFKRLLKELDMDVDERYLFKPLE